MEKQYSVTMVANATHTAEFTTKSTTDNFRPDKFGGEGGCRIMANYDRLLMTTSSGIPDLEEIAGKITHIGYLYRLFKSIDVRNCVMIEDKKFGRRAATSEEELMDVVGCKLTTWKVLKRQLKKYHVLVKQENGEIVDGGERPVRYFVNPLYTMRRYNWIPLSLYELYHRDLDPFLPQQVVDAFHIELIKAGRARIPERKPIKVNIVPERIIPEKTEEEHFECFYRTVLRDNAQLFVAPYFNKMYDIESLPVNDDDAEDKSWENIFYLCQTSGSSNSRKKDDIVSYKNVCVDIDLGKKEDKSYYSVEEVEERKQDIFNRIRPFIPTPSCVTWTRNGFHLIWSIEESNDIDGWFYIANQANKIFAGLNDPSVTCDSARVLRMPYSVHHKEGTDPYYVTIHESNDIVYDIAELINQFENLQPILVAQKDEILEKYPEIKQQQSAKSCTANAKSCTMNAAELNEYHRALANLDLSVFEVPETTQKMTKAEAKEFMKKELNLAELLDLPDNRSFDCIFHITEGGDGNSANVYAPNEKYPYWRYVCHCLGSADIFDCMYRLSGRTFDDILNFLCTICGIELID
ncbi:hypothetical protein [Selenomonas sp. AE3005]|uniref:hypothetical protein n=1 Tax=Selenomonas sp. AE3005 TaxID=1485543 RepID=UPI0004887BB4|nr:hypothetical protein [Selenomonas sp. AE3005]